MNRETRARPRAGESRHSRLFRFGVFEVDLRAGELRKSGRKIKLQEQPFQVLALLLEQPGELVTREELQQKLWPDDTFVDFDHGLHNAINKVREALGDSAQNPRFVETVPRRGYRFIAPVEGAAASPAVPNRQAYVLRLGVSVAVVAITLLTAAWLMLRSPERPVLKFAVAPGEDVHDPVISPDGKYIAYVTFQGEGGLWIQELAAEGPRRIRGTEGARRPFWSPDSRFVGFGAGGSLMSVQADGDRAPVEICKVPTGNYAGGSWSLDGEDIVIAGINHLYRVKASGGAPELLEAPWRLGPDQIRCFWWDPTFIPVGGRSLLLLHAQMPRESQIRILDLESGTHELIARGRGPVFSPTGHVLYQDAGPTPRIWAVAVSLDSLEDRGEPFVVTENAAAPSVSSAGTLSYLAGHAGPVKHVVWRDRSGKLIQAVGGSFQEARYIDLSPTGDEVAISAVTGDQRDAWIVDVEEPFNEPRLLTFDEREDGQVAWSPDGGHVATAGGGARLGSRVTSATRGEPVQFTEPGSAVVDWWGNGGEEYVIVTRRDDAPRSTRLSIWFGRPSQEGELLRLRPFATPESGLLGKLSPGGKHIAYISNSADGSTEVMVRSFPDGGSPWLVSQPGEQAIQPRWSPTGQEIFYVTGGRLVAARVSTKPMFRVASRTDLFRSNAFLGSYVPQYDISADGQRLVLLEPVPTEKPTLRVTQNWFEEFRGF